MAVTSPPQGHWPRVHWAR